MKKKLAFAVALAVFLLADFWLNIAAIGGSGKTYQIELAPPISAHHKSSNQYEFSDAIFGEPIGGQEEVQEVASGPSEALLGKYKVELKAILIENNKPMALIGIKNLEQPLETVGSLSKIIQGQELVGFKVAEVTLNQVTFTQGEQQAVIKIFDGKNDV